MAVHELWRRVVHEGAAMTDELREAIERIVRDKPRLADQPLVIVVPPEVDEAVRRFRRSTTRRSAMGESSRPRRKRDVLEDWIVDHLPLALILYIFAFGAVCFALGAIIGVVARR
jgi:hypothetical protein